MQLVTGLGFSVLIIEAVCYKSPTLKHLLLHLMKYPLEEPCFITWRVSPGEGGVDEVAAQGPLK